MTIIINFTSSASDLDVKDFTILLEELKKKYHFRWGMEHSSLTGDLK